MCTRGPTDPGAGSTVNLAGVSGHMNLHVIKPHRAKHTHAHKQCRRTREPRIKAVDVIGANFLL